MTLEEAFENYRMWAVRKVGSWLLACRGPVDAADDIVQEAFISLVRTAQTDIQYPAALIEKACKNRYLDWVRDNKRMKRDFMRATSMQWILEADPELEWACPKTDVEASALARVEITERLRTVTPYAARQMVRAVLDPTMTTNEKRYVRKVVQYRMKKKERRAAA